MDKSRLEKGGVGGLGMVGQRYNDFIERYRWCGSGGRVGNGRANAYRLEDTTVDKSMMVKGWLGGLGMGGHRHIDLIEDMDSVGSGGRFGNGRANIYILDNMDKSRLEKGGVGGLGMVGQRYNDFIERYRWCGSGGRVGNGRANAYRLEDTTVDKSMMVKGWLGGLGMGGQRHIDLIEDMDSVGSGGRFGNGRANIYAY